jgi:NADH-quinone oxidoreductase subunit C
MSSIDNQKLCDMITDRLGAVVSDVCVLKDMVTIEVTAANLLAVCATLRDEPVFHFEMLLDLCGVDYLDYGVSHWRTEETTSSGFGRGVTTETAEKIIPWHKPRFAVVYHLLSLSNNQRLRIKTYFEGEPPLIPSVITLWPSANWYEREAFDLYGIVFDGHPDLRRLLTDYGFVGHPFRKDFPLIGEVELRYDALQQRCVYEPVSIQPRVLVPKVIRDDNRYLGEEKNG